mgnify:CR=1 FL=1
MTASQVLTNEFFSFVSDFFSDLEDSELYSTISQWIEANKDPLVTQAKIKYGDVPVIFSEDFTVEEIAQFVTVNIANGFARIFYTLTEEYNPYENYFTERTMTTDTDRDNTRNGKITTTPSGKAITETNGSRNKTFNGYENVGQGTTFEEYGDNDFKNISKNKTNGTINDNFTNYGTSTRFENYKVEQEYDNLKDSSTGSEDISESRHGSSGIFSKQELQKREISNRLKYRIMPVFLAMIVSEIESGVYYAS